MTDTNDAVPMTETGLLEPSFADAAKAIESAADLPARTRSHWLCSLRQIAKALDKPMEIIPARWTATRFAVGRLHHARVGANAKTLANHKSNVRAALLWFGNEKNVPRRGMPFTPDWQSLASATVRPASPLGVVVADALLLRPADRPGSRQ